MAPPTSGDSANANTWSGCSVRPRVRTASAKTRFRHYLNLRRTHARLTRLLRDLNWDRMDRIFLDARA